MAERIRIYPGGNPLGTDGRAAVADFVCEVVRADDLLVLRFEFVNLTLDTSGATPQLVRIAADQRALLRVTLPPQHMAEEFFDVNAVGIPEFLPPRTVGAVMANATTLSFEVPATTTSVPFRLADLLAWAGCRPLLAANALPGTSDGAHGGPGIQPVGQETAIEVPYRLQISPDATGRWIHSATAVTVWDPSEPGRSRSELWHTRLGIAGPDGEPNASRLPALRAVWARDLPFPHVKAPPEGSSQLAPLTADQRGQICRLSSDFSMSNSDTDGAFHPAALRARRLVLSALGAWVDVVGAWPTPVPPPVRPPPRAPLRSPSVFMTVPSPPPPPMFDLTDWRHVVSMGRDQYVRADAAGYLLPFGHRALLVTVGERCVSTAPDGGESAYLLRHRYLVVQEPVREFATAALPFKQVHITTLTTPSLDPWPSTPSPGFPTVAGNLLRFHVEVLDKDDQCADYDLPMLWTPITQLGVGVASYNESPNRQALLRNQLIAFAPSAGDGSLNTRLSTRAMSFRSVDAPMPGQSPGSPTMDTADVSLGAIDQLLGSSGSSGAATIQMDDDYVKHGGFAARTAGQKVSPPEVFARLVRPLTLNVPANRAGGVATPRMALDGLTRDRGPVPNTTALVDGLAAGNAGALAEVVQGLDGRLLGGIAIRDVIATTVGPDHDPAAIVPKLVVTSTAHEVTTSFEWTPAVKPLTEGPLPIRTKEDTSLGISASTRAPLTASGSHVGHAFQVAGSLSNFDIVFLDVITLSIGTLEFRAGDGRKASVGIDGLRVTFNGALSFVNQLAQILPVDSFGAGVSLAVSSAGVTAGYTLAVPTVGVGVLSLANVSLSAELFLPFDDSPTRLRLSFADRQHPFLVTIAFLGGGGSFAIAVSTQGVEQIEGSLEFGGDVEVSLGIITANVHVLGGFYFGMAQRRATVPSEPSVVQEITFTGYIRIGGSVDLLGLISVSIELYLGLTYRSAGQEKIVSGYASVTVGVHVLFVDKSFQLSVYKQFTVASSSPSGASSLDFLTEALTTSQGATSFDELLNPQEWQAYCGAFA